MKKELSIFMNLLAKFNCKVERGQENFEHKTFGEMEDVPFVRFDEWLTVYQHENTFFVDHITTTPTFEGQAMGEEPEYETFGSDDLYEALQYASSRMIESEIRSLADYLADEEEAELYIS